MRKSNLDFIIQPFVFFIHNYDFLSYNIFSVINTITGFVIMTWISQFVKWIHKKKCFGNL